MIRFHCGWPKTGTTSLQAALAAQRGRLKMGGIVYPDRWSRRGDDSHNGLVDLLGGAGGAGAGLEQVRRFLDAHAGEKVLFSSESLGAWLVREETHELLLELIAVAGEQGPVTCIWTLRRFDELMHSLCMQMALAERLTLSPAEFMLRRHLDGIFAGMRRVEEAVAGSVVYIKYEDDGSHGIALLEAFGLPPEEARRTERSIGRRPRFNRSCSHKQMVALLNTESLSVRCGVLLDQHDLLDAFHGQGLRFADDRRCELVGPKVRRELHERALDAACAAGIRSYERFFGQDDLGSGPPVTNMSVDVLTDEDLDRLSAHLLR